MSPRTGHRIHEQITNFQQKGAGLLATLLVAASLAACTDEGAPADDRVDIRPRWTEGEKYRIREEQEHRRGTGPFPPAGEVTSRTRSIEREESAYEDTVLEGVGTRLVRVRRTYTRSFRNTGGEDEPTVLQGNTYEITAPFADRGFRLDRVAEDGSKKPAGKEEQKLVRVGLWRVAASLLPVKPVRVGASWRPGRPVPRGQAGVDMTARLAGVTLSEGRRTARVESETNVRPEEGIHVTMRESVDVDLTAFSVAGYRGLTEWYNTRGQGRPETWRRVTATLTITPAD